jgi:hypothetical protein
MKIFAYFTMIAVILGLAAPCYPAVVMDDKSLLLYDGEVAVAGKTMLIVWHSSKDINPQTKVKLVLLKNNTLYRVIATNFPLTDGSTAVFTPPDSRFPGGAWLGKILWTPATSDIGCNYKFQLNAVGNNSISATGQQFNISPTDRFSQAANNPTWVKLDAPHAMEQLLRGHAYQIKWTCIPSTFRWPTGNLKLELFDGNNKVADIATLNVNFNSPQCPIHGSYNWVVGNNLTPGNNYRIRISGDNNWMGDNFLIIITSYKPGSGTKIHKVGEGTVPDIK